MKKEFSGYDLKSLVTEIDQWLADNQASFYGSKPMVRREEQNATGQIYYTITVKYIYN